MKQRSDIAVSNNESNNDVLKDVVFTIIISPMLAFVANLKNS